MAELENILITSPANFNTMSNGEMVTQVHGDSVVSYLKSNNNIYTLKWQKHSESAPKGTKSHAGSNKYETQKFGWRIKDSGESEFESVDSRVSVNSLNWKFFTGTSAAKQLFTEITHGILNGKKRIVAVSTNIQSDSSPSASSGSIPVNSFIAGAGNIQDEHNEDREFVTLYDDTKVYIFIDGTSDDVQTNRFTCAVFYTDHDLY